MTTADGAVIPIIAYDQLLREEKNRQTWAAIGAALGAAANGISAANAGYSHGTVSAFGNGGSAFGTWNSYNGGQAFAAQAIANQQNAAMFSRMAETNADQMEAPQVNLRTTTVDPGASFGGQVMFELPKDMRKKKVDYPVVLAVKFGEEVHTFNAVLRYRRK
jgi:hypothetical protein